MKKNVKAIDAPHLYKYRGEWKVSGKRHFAFELKHDVLWSKARRWANKQNYLLGVGVHKNEEEC